LVRIWVVRFPTEFLAWLKHVVTLAYAFSALKLKRKHHDWSRHISTRSFCAAGKAVGMNPALACAAILPGDPPQPCPELLTEQEAIRYLRLDLIDTDDPAGTLRYYRKQGLLRATQVGKCIRYRRIELERLLDRLTENNPR
jgi:hypothetical protein